MEASIYRTSLGRAEELELRQLCVGQLLFERFLRRILLMITGIANKQLILLLERSNCRVPLGDDRDGKKELGMVGNIC